MPVRPQDDNVVMATVTHISLMPVVAEVVNNIAEHGHQQGREGEASRQSNQQPENIMMAFSTETSRIEKKSRHLLPRQVAINDSANGEKQAKQNVSLLMVLLKFFTSNK